MAGSAGYPARDMRAFSPPQPGYYSPRGFRKDSVSSNESSEGDDNIVMPRPPQSPPSAFNQNLKGTAASSTFSPFAAEFAPARSGSSSSNASESDHSGRSSHRAPSTPGLIDFDSPNSVDTPLDTPQHELPGHARQQQAQHMTSTSSNDTKSEWMGEEHDYEIADEILRLQIEPQQQSLTSRAATFPQSLNMAPMHEPPSAALGNSGLRRMSSPPPAPVRSPSPLRSKLHPSARPWSPSPLRHVQRPGSTATASTVTPGPRELHSTVAGWPSSPHPGQLPAPQVFTPTKLGSLDESRPQPFHLYHQQQQQAGAPEASSRSRLSGVEAGEPEDSFPLSAFAQWREQHNKGQHRPIVSSPSPPAPRSSAASPMPMPMRRGAAHRRQGSDTSLNSSRGSSVDVYDLRSGSRPLSRTSQQQQQFPSQHGQTPSAAPSPSTIPLSFLERQQRRQSAVMTASMASARRSSGSSAGSSGAFDLQEDFPRSRGTPPVSYAQQQQGSSHMYDTAAMLPGAGLPGAGLPPAPSPSSVSHGSHSHTPSPGAVNSLASLYQLNQLGVDPQTSDAILRLAATQPKVFAQLAGNTAASTSGSQGGPSPNNRKINLYKTELCRSWEEKGSCRYGAKCQFAHSKNELRVVNRHPKYKTQVCRTFWFTGECPYGRRCCFLHNTVPGDNTPLSPAGPNDQYMEQPQLPGGCSMGNQDSGLSSRLSQGSLANGQQQEPLLSSVATASPLIASAGYGQNDALGDAFPTMYQQHSPWASRNLSRSSSANSNSQQRGNLEPSQAEHALLRGSSPQSLLIDLEKIQRQQQQKQQPLYVSQSGTSGQQRSMSPFNTHWTNAEAFSTGSNISFSDSRFVGGKASTGLPANPSSATSGPSPSPYYPDSPFSPYASDSFNSPTSGAGSVLSPFTPMSATSQAPTSSLNADEGKCASFTSPEAFQTRMGSEKHGDQHNAQGSPGYAAYGAIGAPRHSTSRRSSDNDDEVQGSGLAHHAKFLSQLAAASDCDASSN